MKVKQGIIFLAAALMVSGSLAGTIATPHVAGSFDGWAGPNSYPMAETFLGSDVWEVTISGLVANDRHEFKVTDGTWGTSIPGPNSWLFTDGAGAITISYDGNTYADGWSPNIDRLGLSTDGGGVGWTVAGDFQDQIGGGNWDPANPNTTMTHEGGGIYSFSAVLAPGTYAGKAVVSGSWDSISWDGRSVGTADNGFNIDAVNDTVVFTVDSFAGTSKVEVIPEPSSMLLVLAGSLTTFVVRRLRS